MLDSYDYVTPLRLSPQTKEHIMSPVTRSPTTNGGGMCDEPCHVLFSHQHEECTTSMLRFLPPQTIKQYVMRRTEERMTSHVTHSSAISEGGIYQDPSNSLFPTNGEGTHDKPRHILFTHKRTMNTRGSRQEYAVEGHIQLSGFVWNSPPPNLINNQLVNSQLLSLPQALVTTESLKQVTYQLSFSTMLCLFLFPLSITQTANYLPAKVEVRIFCLEGFHLCSTF